jgi:hypothetical protein
MHTTFTERTMCFATSVVNVSSFIFFDWGVEFKGCRAQRRPHQ